MCTARRKRLSKLVGRKRDGDGAGDDELDKDRKTAAFPPATLPTARFTDLGGIEKCLLDVQVVNGRFHCEQQHHASDTCPLLAARIHARAVVILHGSS